ncbi:hypothetical protein AAVH_04790 [Aphelenchoides avenae]|nr:hypothetical protein AAVH_04790 [Aphelenchus avenae]
MPGKKGASKAAASAVVNDQDSNQPSGSGTSSSAAAKKRTRSVSSRAAKKAKTDQVTTGQDDAVSLKEGSSASAPPARKIKKTRAQTEVEDLKDACKFFVTALVDGKMPSQPGVKGTASLPSFALPHTIIALDRLLQIDGFDAFLRKRSMAKYNKLIRAVRDEAPNAPAAAKARAASRDRDDLNEQSLFVFSSVAAFIADLLGERSRR